MVSGSQERQGSVQRRTFLKVTGVGAALLTAAKPGVATAVVTEDPPPPPTERPRISYVTPGVGDGATMVIVGDEFSADAEVWLLRPPKDKPADIKASYGDKPVPLPATPPSNAVKTTVLGEPDPHLIAAGQLSYPTIQWDPSAVPTVVWVKTALGFSDPYVMNKPELFFLEDSVVVPGQAIRVFGRDLEPAREVQHDFPVAIRNKKTGSVSWGSYLLSSGQEQANDRPYVATVVFPDQIAPGGYELSLHGLYAGGHGWSNSLDVQVVKGHDLITTMAREDKYHFSPTVKSSPPRGRVMSAKGLHGDGVADDTDALQRAVDAIASSGGGVLSIPAGAFAISRAIRVPSGVVLSGAGKGATRLTVSPLRPVTGSFPIKKLFTSPDWVSGFAGDYLFVLQPQVPMVWLESMSGIQNLRIEVGRGASIGVLLGTTDPAGRVKRSFVKNVEIVNQQSILIKPGTFSTLFGGILAVSATDGVTIAGCRILANSDIWFLAGRYVHRHARIANNVFESYPHNNSGTVSFNTLSESVFEDNEFKTGPRAFTANMGTCRNFVSGNLIRNVGGLLNGSEMLMSEDSGVLASGTAKAATANTVTLNTDLGMSNDQIVSTSVTHYAYVLTGRGTGQYRQITGNTGNTLTLAANWTVLPDATSTVQVMRATVRNIYTNNWFADVRGPVVPSGGAAMENIIAGNELHSSADIILTAVPGVAIPGISPTAYNLIAQNRMVSSSAISLLNYTNPGNDYGKPPLYDTGGMFANTVRQNQVWTRATPGGENQYYNIWFQANYKNAPDKQGAINVYGNTFSVVEDNYIYNTKNGVLIDSGRKNVVRWNRMDSVEKRILTANSPVGTVIQDPPPFQE